MKDINFFHGIVLARIVGRKCVFLKKIDKSTYCLNNKIYFYIKYSTHRMPPWTFSFLKEHVEKIVSFCESRNKIYILLVCNGDGICCLNFEEFKIIISPKNNLYPKWIKVFRRKREKYSVTGSDGALNYKIGNSDFPNKLNENMCQGMSRDGSLTHGNS